MNASSLVESRRGRLALTALAILPIVVAVVRALTTDWIPVGDDGLLALRVDDVLSAHHPLLGSWTSASISLGEDVNNPGAWYAYLASAPVALFGPVVGTAIAVGTLNALAVVAIGWGGRRLGGARAEVWMLCGAAALGWVMGSELLVDLWQPHALLLPVLLTLVLAACVAVGRTWALPALMFVASVVVQTHLGHAVVISIVVVTALVSGAIRRRSAFSPPRRLLASRPLQITVGVTILAWVPSLVEQLQNGEDGNLSRLVRNLRNDEPVLGLGRALGLFAEILLAPWSRRWFESASPDIERVRTGSSSQLVENGVFHPVPSVLVVAVFASALIAVLVWSRRTDRSALFGAATIATAASAAVLLALTTMIIGVFGVAAHHVRWAFVVALFVHVVLAWAVLAYLGDHVESLRSAATVVPAVLVIAFTVVNLPGFAHDSGPVEDRWARPALNSVADQLENVSIPGPIVYDTTSFNLFEPYSGTVMMLLGDQGIDFRVEDPTWLRQLGDERRADGDEIGRLFQLQGVDVALYDGPACPIARTTASGEVLDDELGAIEEADGRWFGLYLETDLDCLRLSR